MSTTLPTTPPASLPATLPVREVPLVLASRSPQRLALLARLGIAPRIVLAADIDEATLKKETARALVARLALAKARAAQEAYLELLNKQQSTQVASQVKISHVLAADTVILCARRILGKPRDLQQAREFLKRLSGRRHQVWCAVVLAQLQLADKSNKNEQENKAGSLVSIRIKMTRVAFKRLTTNEIEDYLATNEWQGAAASYRIQGYAEAFVRSLNGSHSAVVGLPLFETRQLLLAQNLL